MLSNISVSTEKNHIGRIWKDYNWYKEIVKVSQTYLKPKAATTGVL